jgi:GntR family transcriptional regulator
MVMLDSISYLADGRPVEYYHAVHRGDRSRFEVELVRYRDTAKDAQGTVVIPGDLPHSNPLIH